MSNPTISIDSTHIRSPPIPSSPRTSTPPPLPPTTTTSSTTHAPPTSNKTRNALLLRQFYGLPSPSATPSTPTSSTFNQPANPLDNPNFSAEPYLNSLLTTQDLLTLLKSENELVNEIRGLDGERKALVYDNYSRLIVAVEMIGKMRGNMEPLSPTTSTLEPAISHISELSSSLVHAVSHSTTTTTSTITANPSTPTTTSQTHKRNTVKWTLSAPDRFSKLIESGNKEEAEKEWVVVKGLLEKWGDGVRGVKELREKCGEIMNG